MDDGGSVTLICMKCQTIATFTVSDNGFYYCENCGQQADDFVDTVVDDSQVSHSYKNAHSRSLPTQTPNTTTTNQHYELPETKHIATAANNDYYYFTGSTKPNDFGGLRKEFDSEVVSSRIRARYLNGLRVMIQLQCEALVNKFGVSPLVVGLIGPIWLRFLVCKGVTSDDWAVKAVDDDEGNTQQEIDGSKGEVEELNRCGSDAYCAKFRSEHFSIHKKRLVMIWLRSLTSKIPVSCTLAISFLVCHVAREAILPTDVLRWTLEGKLPYLSAFTEIEKHLGRSPDTCPISNSRMFRPVVLISTQKLEAKAAKIAKKIGLDLPPVNFYAIASRYCRTLSLPTTKKILATACQICDWCVPPELYLSSNEFRIPTRVYVMSVLIVAMRIIFDINGYGFWESSLSDTNSCSQGGENEDVEPQCHSSADEVSGSENSRDQDSKLNAGELLQILEAKYNELDEEMFLTEIGRRDCSLPGFDFRDFSSDLSSYIKYCEDVVFSENLRPLYNREENNLWTEFQEFYQKTRYVVRSRFLEVREKPNCQVESSDYSAINNKRSRKGSSGSSFEPGKVRNSYDDKQDKSTDSAAYHYRGHYSKYSMDQDDDCSQDNQGCSASCSRQSPQMESCLKDTAIRRMKLEMEENKFCYMPPRTRVKREAYLHYARKKKDVFTYAVHADYYILLRSCAKVAQVETRVMHTAVLSFERRLKWLEKKMDDSLNLTQNLDSFCDYCQDGPP